MKISELSLGCALVSMALGLKVVIAAPNALHARLGLYPKLSWLQSEGETQ